MYKMIESLNQRSQIKEYIQNKNYTEATKHIENMLRLNPSDINECLKEFGEIYEAQNMYYEAVSCYIKILNNVNTQMSTIYQITNQIGICYFNVKTYKLAIHYFNKVLKMKQHPDAYNNIGRCYMDIKKYKDSEIAFLKSYNMNYNETSINSLGLIYYYIKDYDKSIHFFLKTKNNDGNLPGLAISYLAKKEFKKGFELYENRLIMNAINQQTQIKERVDIPLPYWNGVVECARLLIVSEQGLGDNIQYYRFIIELSEKYPKMRITFFCKKEIAHIFNTYSNIEIINELFIPTYNYMIYIMSLPSILNISTIESNKINYIKTNSVKFNYWKDKTSELTKFKVGIVYNGLLSSFIDKYIPLNQYKILCDLNIDLIIIHKKNEIEHDLTAIDFTDKIIHYDIDYDAPFEDTICLLQNIDLLITVDTFIVHLAGILNVKTWLLLGSSEWRWSNDEYKTYWYDSVELIRTKDDQEFSDLLPTVKDKLLTVI